MGFTITTTKQPVPAVSAKSAMKVASAPKTKASVEIAKAVELVDKIIAANALIQAAKDPKKQQDKAKSELLDLVELDYSPTEEIIITGTLGKVKFSNKSNIRSVVDMKAIHKMLGDEAFYALATLSLKSIDDYLTPAQRANVLSESYGSRTMSVLPIGDDD